MLIRKHVGRDVEIFDGMDEGGPYVMVEVAPLPQKLRTRMARCAGCHDDFYNGRANFSCNHCWSLTRESNFNGKGKSTCYH